MLYTVFNLTVYHLLIADMIMLLQKDPDYLDILPTFDHNFIVITVM